MAGPNNLAVCSNSNQTHQTQPNQQQQFKKKKVVIKSLKKRRTGTIALFFLRCGLPLGEIAIS